MLPLDQEVAKITESTLKDLKKVYESSIKQLEKMFKYKELRQQNVKNHLNKNW